MKMSRQFVRATVAVSLRMAWLMSRACSATCVSPCANKSKKKKGSTINTRHILFVVSGAFAQLDKIVQRRLKESSIGFASNKQEDIEKEQILEHAKTPDFIKYGFEPEFVGRLPVRVVCHSLSINDLEQILKTSEGSIIRQYKQSFAAYGIKSHIEDTGLRRIAELAIDEDGFRPFRKLCCAPPFSK